ncbi:MAG: endonuclease [Chloroflexi bacterium]|nr:endonuclease [Chloroflexota bacterium]
MSDGLRESLMAVYERMLSRYGPQGWWPGGPGFEMMVGAVLTQAASWANVESALANLRSAGALTPRAIRAIPQDELARLVHPSGYYNAKARKLKALAEYIGERFDDDLDAMAHEDVDTLRNDLLGVYGIGEETADDILLYAMGKPSFVVDAYTRRLFWRLGLAPAKGSYAGYRAPFMQHLPKDPRLFGEYHALVVRHGKEVCKKEPVCEGCCLLEVCPTGQDRTGGSASLASSDSEEVKPV